MQRAFLGVLVLAAAVAVGGCDNDVDNPSPTEPPPTITETFTGTINANGAMTHAFAVNVAGRLTATLTSVTPDPEIAVGFALGTWSPSTSVCQQVITRDDALQGVILTGDASGAGTLCVRVFDTGKVAGELNYTITVVHP